MPYKFTFTIEQADGITLATVCSDHRETGIAAAEAACERLERQTGTFTRFTCYYRADPLDVTVGATFEATDSEYDLAN